VTIINREAIMRPFLAVAAIASAFLIPLSAHARVDGPWCAEYSLGAGTWVQDCSMRTFEMCRMEVIAGNRGYCSVNPRWQGAVADGNRARRAKKRKRH
jgi:hypothetical protein